MHQPRHLLDGVPASTIFIDNRAMSYGDGLFETILCLDGTPMLWDLHIRRLVSGAARLGLQMSEQLPVELKSQVDSLLAGQDGARVIKLVLFRAGLQRGYGVSGAVGIHTRVSLYPLEQPDFIPRNDLRVRLCSTRLGINPLTAGLKHLNRLEQVLASSEDSSGAFDEGLMLDLDENIIEGTRTNVFFMVADRLVTPDLKRCGVDGVMRNHLLQIADRSGIRIEIRDIKLDDLPGFNECAICSSLIGLQGVTGIFCENDSPLVFAPGPVTLTLQSVLRDNLFDLPADHH